MKIKQQEKEINKILKNIRQMTFKLKDLINSPLEDELSTKEEFEKLNKEIQQPEADADLINETFQENNPEANISDVSVPEPEYEPEVQAEQQAINNQ
jgi:hypothetical protein